MPDLDRARAIARRELGAYFGQPLAWVFLAGFLALAAGPALPAFFAEGVADLRGPLSWLHVALVLLAPAAAMRLWSEERASGTYELLFTLPVRAWEVVAGKFAAGLALIGLAVGLWCVVPLTLACVADLDPGQALSGALGALLLGAALLAGGMLASALTRSQVVAFVLGATFGMVLMVVTSADVLEKLLPHDLVPVAADLGAARRLESFGRGLLDTRDVAYFLALTATLLLGNVLAVERGARRGEQALAGALALAALVLLVDLSGQRPVRARVDVTAARANSLSTTLREALGRLERPLVVRAYVTQDLPAGFENLRPQVRALVDLLHDMRDAAPGRVLLDLQDPLSIDLDLARRQELERRAELDGVPPTIVSSVGGDQAQQLRVYAGVAFLHGDRAPAALPRAILRETLELDVATAISRVTQPRLRVSWSGDGLADCGQARAALAQAHAVEDLDLEALDVPDGVSLLVHVAPVPPSARELAALERFLRRGGRVVLLAEARRVDGQRWAADPYPLTGLAGLLRAWGLQLGPGLALAPAERARAFTVDGALVQSRYPWVLELSGQADPASPVLAGVGRAILPFAAAVAPTDPLPAGARFTPLCRTRPGWTAGATGGAVDVHPLHAAPREGEAAPVVVAAAVTGAEGGRLVLVGDADFPRDQQTGEAQGVDLLVNLVDWTLDRALLAPVRARGAAAPLPADAAFLGFVGPRAEGAVLAVCVWLVPGLVLVGGLGGLDLARRRGAARAARARDARSDAVAKGGA